MLYNYFISSYRLFIRRKTTTLIMVTGLAVSMAVAFVILEYVRFESSFDHHHEKADRIFRVTHSLYENNKLQYQRAQSFIPIGETLKNEFESVEDFTTLFKISDQTDVIISAQPAATTTQAYNEKSVYHVKGNFFSIFSVKMLEGNGTPASIGRNKVFISSSTARKYFGDESPINRTIEHQYSGEFTVEGVFEDFPPDSHFHPDFLFGWTPLSDEASGGDANNWRWDGFFTYILLKRESDRSVVENNFSAALDKHLSNLEGRQSRFMLQPLTEIHLHSHLLGEAEPNGDPTTINLMKALGVFVLLMAYINFINLASAHSVERLKQTAIRKIVGSGLLQLRFQFLIEGFIINLIAGILAACFVYISNLVLKTLGILPLGISILQLSWFFCPQPDAHLLSTRQHLLYCQHYQYRKGDTEQIKQSTELASFILC